MRLVSVGYNDRYVFSFSVNIGIKHEFLCINICWAQREVLKPEPERRGFQHLPRIQQMLIYQEGMIYRYYCRKPFFSFFVRKLWRKCFKKVLFTCTYIGAEKYVTCERFENAAYRAKTNVIDILHFTDDDVSFYDGPESLFVKPQSHALTARKLPC